MPVRDLDYDLPEALIATRPAEPRDAARLIVVDRSGRRFDEMRVRDLPEVLREGDVLVFNATRVLPARLMGRRVGTGGNVEGLFLSSSSPGTWTCLWRGGHLRAGVEMAMVTPAGEDSGVVLRLLDRAADQAGAWRVAVLGAAADQPAETVLSFLGRTPLPPYILRARGRSGQCLDEDFDRERYQTVYARQEASLGRGAAGSVAAPTAGLHFTPELLERLDRVGVRRLEVILHVGTGTFRPVESEWVENHVMHEEWCSIDDGTLRELEQARARGRRIIAVGTTSARTLESFAMAAQGGAAQATDQPPIMAPRRLATRLLIVPGHRWRWCDGLMTNFHLPRSTLMAMVGAMLDGGVESLRAIYLHAIGRGYRFYSYGDAMIVLPQAAGEPRHAARLTGE
ncbi:MAG: tRNA preQ1(34) S-adenosylmethionine ribosyltransferase-isomerase QueA [Phycisphaerae bacterium]|nr:tRNA preQ1(34) S-adenosylmethionine ribosyltransferase-isomerase QueA [Phycisphaerae bacterium]